MKKALKEARGRLILEEAIQGGNVSIVEAVLDAMREILFKDEVRRTTFVHRATPSQLPLALPTLAITYPII